MKLLRASCACGYRTRKARSGNHYYQWWFPVFNTAAGTLSDVLAALPQEDRERIDLRNFDIYMQTPRDDMPRRREMSLAMQAFDDEVSSNFITRETIALRNHYSADETCIFDPPLAATFFCPQCGGETLSLKQVSVIAFCKTGCAHEYQWLDSETAGCPKCGHRPHRFQMEHEFEYSSFPRTICGCACSSSTDCLSHIDGYCPKCGNLPADYEVGGVHFCGRHHEPFVDYRCPSNFLFIEADSRWAAARFPNAKLWGDARSGDESMPGSYCVTCESDRLRWLESHAEEDESESRL